VAASASPTVMRRRLAAELRQLRGGRTGATVAKALGWSTAKISRYELAQTSFPPDEVEKLLDYYGVEDSRRTQLLTVAEEANRAGWWEEYADALAPEYMEFIGLEAGASSVAHWELEVVPGLLQTAGYARRIMSGYEAAVRVPPGILERRVKVRMIRQKTFAARKPPLNLSLVIDESVLLRRVAPRELMYEQMRHLADCMLLPHIELRILPLATENPAMGISFTIFGFDDEFGTEVGDVVSTESPKGQVFIEDEEGTYVHRLAFNALARASLPPAESLRLIRDTAERVWL
jgi:transcriptional regulator with XRE-family HTH domain